MREGIHGPTWEEGGGKKGGTWAKDGGTEDERSGGGEGIGVGRCTVQYMEARKMKDMRREILRV